MSTRQRARLISTISSSKDNNQEEFEENDEKEEKEIVSFSLLNNLEDNEDCQSLDEEELQEESENESENENDSDSENEEKEQIKVESENNNRNNRNNNNNNNNNNKLNLKKKKRNKKELFDDIDEILNQESQLNSNNSNSNNNNNLLLNYTRNDQFLYVNPTELDIDSLLRRKFGHFQNQSTSQRSTKGSNFLSRSYIFGKCKPEWPRHVTYVNGGVNLINCSPPEWCHEENITWCRFIYSFDYSKTQKEFEIICNTGDLNLLILFLSVNPTHFESLYNVGNFFSRTGDMDRASDLIQRSLYYQECSGGNLFHPWRSQSHLPCQLSYDFIENQIYFKTLFLHMQIVWMKGCRSISVDIAKVLLSLNPQIDPMNILLLIDRYLLISSRYNEIQQFCHSSASIVLQLPFKKSDQRFLLHEILPNWAYSLYLGTKLNKTELSQEFSFIETCLTKFPFMLWYIIDESLLSVNNLQIWNKIKSHPFFQYFSSLKRIERSIGRKSVQFFSHFGECYKKGSSLASQSNSGFLPVHHWCHPSNIQWIFQECEQFISQLNDIQSTISKTNEYLQNISSLLAADGNEFLDRYLNCQLEIFQEEFTRLPAEANPLNAAVMDPRILERDYTPPLQTLNILAQYGVGSRNRIKRRNNSIEEMMIPGGAIEMALTSGIINMEAIRSELALLQERGLQGVDVEEFLTQINQMNSHPSQRWYLDPSLPLLQLFLATFLPWYHFDTRRSNNYRYR